VRRGCSLFDDNGNDDKQEIAGLQEEITPTTNKHSYKHMASQL
jgi:hypothetical protein